MQINGVFSIQKSWQQHSMSPRIFVCFLMIFEKLMLFLHCWCLTIIACSSLGKLTQLCNSLALTCFLWFVYFNSSIFLLLGWTSCLCFLVHDSDLLFMHRKLWHWPHRCRLHPGTLVLVTTFQLSTHPCPLKWSFDNNREHQLWQHLDHLPTLCWIDTTNLFRAELHVGMQ